jgi:ammonia channel protein AmtB
MQSAGISGGVASLTLAAEGARAVGDIRYSLGEWLPYIALGVIILAAGWTIYERVQQRRKGIA